jgi:hypothetical protein
MTRPICWLLQPPSQKHDLSGLDYFGETKVLFQRGFYPDDVDIFTDSLIGTMDDKFSEFLNERDFIVPLGDACVVAMVVAYLAFEFQTPIQFLKYDKKLSGFYQVDITPFSPSK